MGIIELIGGLGLTLFGIRFLRKGLERLFGGRLALWIGRLTASPLKAFGGGIIAGTIAPSSTGLSLFASQMLDRGQINARRMLAVLLGANVGMTVLVQLLAFKVTDFAGLLIIIGVIAFQYLRRESFRGVGQCLLALGFIFLAIGMISNGAREMTASPEWVEIFRILQRHPWVIFLAMTALGLLLQSSTAAVGLGLGLSASGLLDATGLIPWVLGTNVGLGLTSLIAGWRQLEGRRMGAANLLLKAGVAVGLMLVPYSTLAAFEIIPGSLMRQTALFHTGYNLLVGLIALPILALMERLSAFLIRDPAADQFTADGGHLDPALLDTPSFALARATRETLRMSDHVRLMLQRCWEGRGDVNLARRIRKEDAVVNQINFQLKDYLCRISDIHKPDDLQWQLILLSFSNELESIGDLIDKHLCDQIIKQANDGVELHPEDEKALHGVYRSVILRYEIASGLLTSRSNEDASGLLAAREPFADQCRRIQHEHYNRLHTMPRSASVIFLDYLSTLQRISSHLDTIGDIFCRGGFTLPEPNADQTLPSRSSTEAAS